MDDSQKLRLLYRQLKDIQAQADNIIRDNRSVEEIGQFKKYSAELKTFILANFQDAEIVRTALEIPDELYQPSAANVGLLATVVAFVPGISSYMHEREKIRQSIDTIDLVRGKYSTLEFLIRSIY